jgi:tetratricopeptide (TPR) repeat protein
LTSENLPEKLRQIVEDEGTRLGSIARRRRLVELGVVILSTFAICSALMFLGFTVNSSAAIGTVLLAVAIIGVNIVLGLAASNASKSLQRGQTERAKLMVARLIKPTLQTFPLTLMALMYLADTELRILLAEARFVEAETLAGILLVAYQRFRLFSYGNSVEAALKNFIAIAYLGQGRYEQAKSLFQACLANARKPVARRVFLNNIGYCDLELGNLDSAYKSLSESAFSTKKRHGYERAIFITASSNLARVCVKKSLLQEAEDLLEKAMIEAEKETDAAQSTGPCFEALGELRFAQGRLEEAEHYLRNALDAVRVKSSEISPHFIRAASTLSYVLEALGKNAEATELAARAVSNREALNKNISDTEEQICKTASPLALWYRN